MSVNTVEIGDPKPRISLAVGRPDDSNHAIFDVSTENGYEAANVTEAQAREIIDALVRAYPALLVDLGYVKGL